MIENPKTCFHCKYGHIPKPFEKNIPCKYCDKYDKFENGYDETGKRIEVQV